MKRYIFILYAIFCTAILPQAEEPKLILVPEIAQYYEDINYVATRAKPIELLTIVTYLAGLNDDGGFLREPHQKALYDRIVRLRSIEVGIDPSISKMTVISPGEYSFTATVVEIITQEKNHLVVKVRRAPTASTNQDIHDIDGFVVHGNRGGLFFRLSDASSESLAYVRYELHNWIFVDNEWRISSVRFFLISD